MRSGFQYYKFEIKPERERGWAFLNRSETPVADGILFNWDTRNTLPGPYWLRLVVVDRTGNYWEESPEIRLFVTSN